MNETPTTVSFPKRLANKLFLNTKHWLVHYCYVCVKEKPLFMVIIILNWFVSLRSLLADEPFERFALLVLMCCSNCLSAKVPPRLSLIKTWTGAFAKFPTWAYDFSVWRKKRTRDSLIFLDRFAQRNVYFSKCKFVYMTEFQNWSLI